IDQQLHDRVGAPIGGSVQCRLGVEIEGIHISAELERDFYALECFFFGSWIFTWRMNAAARGDHEQRGVVCVEELRNRAEVQQAAYRSGQHQSRATPRPSRSDLRGRRTKTV